MTITYILLGRQQPVFFLKYTYYCIHILSIYLQQAALLACMESCNMSIIVIFVV